MTFARRRSMPILLDQARDTRLALTILASCLVGCSGASTGELPAISVEPGSLTVSGVSSGGYMAVQYQVAYSGSVAGAGIVAAGPWYCAQNSVATALGSCMKGEDPAPDVPALVAAAREAAQQGTIDDTDGLAPDRVWVFHGTKDDRVMRPVSDALVAFYREFIPESQIDYEDDIPAAHGFPTLDEGVACDMASEPWLNDCDFDAAGQLLQHLYGPLKPPAGFPESSLREFDQGHYADGALPSMARTGYVYVPKRCAEGAECRVHVAFHGCRQGTSFVGRAFVRNAGYNGWAEANDIVVLYPQATRSLVSPLNPQGCWDWWGYTGPDYATRSGAQLAIVHRMLEALGLR